MAFTQFPREQYFRVLETDTITRMGNFQVPDGTELQHMMLTLFIRGVIASPVNMRVNIYGSDSNETAEFSSEWITLSTTTLSSSPAYTQNWFGNVYADFSGNPLNPNVVYYMTCETSGYTRNGDTFYIGLNLDWYSPVNTQISPIRPGARMRILGKR